MARRHHTPEQVAAALRQLEAGIPAVELCRKLGIHENTMYLWKKKYGSLGTPEIRELRQLRDENVRLKRLVADLTLDRAVLQDVLKKKMEHISGEAGTSQEDRRLFDNELPRKRAASSRECVCCSWNALLS